MRGSSFTLPGELLGAVGSAKDAHFASILPGRVRGNHYHKEKDEHLLVFNGCPWALFWDDGEGTPVQQRRFEGDKVVIIGIRPGAAHAMVNTGTRELFFVGLSDRAFSALSPDAHARKVTPDEGL
jgi:dTDP-4-dehydrorhamnose 3,5-epimerase-like enzyme